MSDMTQSYKTENGSSVADRQSKVVLDHLMREKDHNERNFDSKIRQLSNSIERMKKNCTSNNEREIVQNDIQRYQRTNYNNPSILKSNSTKDIKNG